MYRILESIVIIGKSEVSQSTFINQEMQPAVNCAYKCNKCTGLNRFSITPYETGFPFSEIYLDSKVLPLTEIDLRKLAFRTSPWLTYLGAYTVADLPTLYFGTNCSKCGTHYLTVFGCGEKQPGLLLCEISGVWQFCFLHDKE